MATKICPSQKAFIRVKIYCKNNSEHGVSKNMDICGQPEYQSGCYLVMKVCQACLELAKLATVKIYIIKRKFTENIFESEIL